MARVVMLQRTFWQGRPRRSGDVLEVDSAVAVRWAQWGIATVADQATPPTPPRQKEPPAQPAQPLAGRPLPEDFPGLQALVATGLDTYDKLDGVTLDELVAIKGIGTATAQRVLQALEE